MTHTLNIQTATVNTHSGDWQIPAYLAQPISAGPFPVVVVIQEIFGVNAHIRDVTERIAKEGYIAIAPHIYHRQVPYFEVGYSDADVVLGRQYKNGTQADELLSDIQAAIDYARTLANAKPTGVGCIGFCFGGHVTYLAATLKDVIAAADFYGAGVTTLQPGREQPTVTLTPQITGTLYGFFGSEDPLIPNQQVDEIEAALQQHAIPHQIFRYAGATHGFFCDRRASYHPEAAADAWERVKTLFSEKL
ncbi:dienelactone hydrolase family protein [Almyronema epifaneia]|uniref:Dienelactone hydrolase family protein n=1 Tax=Almyronema epifaneia S1 TaxID=2991925 RepID=A0ABW6I9H8_9CYAN